LFSAVDERMRIWLRMAHGLDVRERGGDQQAHAVEKRNGGWE